MEQEGEDNFFQAEKGFLRIDDFDLIKSGREMNGF
jgi:hypothetical protein